MRQLEEGLGVAASRAAAAEATVLVQKPPSAMDHPQHKHFKARALKLFVCMLSRGCWWTSALRPRPGGRRAQLQEERADGGGFQEMSGPVL